MTKFETLYLPIPDGIYPFLEKEFFLIKRTLNPNFVNLTINREKCCSRNGLALFGNLLLLKSCKEYFHL